MRINKAFKKAVTYCLINSLLITPLIVFVLSGELILSLGVGIVNFLVKVCGYYVHEKIWERK